MIVRRGHLAVVAGFAGSVIVLAPSARAQQSEFEGSVSMRLAARTAQGASAQGASAQAVEFLMRGGKLRVNMGGPVGGMAMLVVPREQKIYLLLAAQNAYSELPLAVPAGAPSAEATSNVSVVRTGRSETIAGYSCEHVQVTAAEQTTDVCLAKGLGRFVNPLEAMRGGGPVGWQKAVSAEGFPLKVTLADGTVALEVTKVEPKRLANDLFSVPLSYTKMELPRRR